jgi:hypothetical protein
MTTEESGPPAEFITKYRKGKDYHMYFADAAVVRKAVGNAILLDFFTGQFDLADELNTRKPDTTYSRKYLSPEKPLYTRELQAGIVMTLETAKDMADHLQGMIREFYNLTKNAKEVKESK